LGSFLETIPRVYLKMPKNKGKQRQLTAEKVIIGGAQLRRTLKVILTQGVATTITGQVIGDGNDAATVQPNGCASWASLQNDWQEYRVRRIRTTCYAPVQNPAVGTNVAIPIPTVVFTDRTGDLTLAQVKAASNDQVIDQEQSKFTCLWVNQIAHPLRHTVTAVDAEDFQWLATHNGFANQANRFQQCWFFSAVPSGDAGNLFLLVEFDCEFKGRANVGLVEFRGSSDVGSAPPTPLASEIPSAAVTSCSCGSTSCPLCLATAVKKNRRKNG